MKCVFVAVAGHDGCVYRIYVYVSYENMGVCERERVSCVFEKFSPWSFCGSGGA